MASGNSSSCCRVSRFGPDCFQLVQRPFLWFDQAFYIRSCEEEVFSRRETTAQLELSLFPRKKKGKPSAAWACANIHIDWILFLGSWNTGTTEICIRLDDMRNAVPRIFVTKGVGFRGARSRSGRTAN